MEKKQSIKQDLVQYLLVLLALLIVSVLSSNIFFRLDLTAENRYTLSKSTKSILRDLDEPVYVRIYLSGELPSEFVRFQVSIRELLDEFRARAGDKIQYDFINLYDEQDETLRNKIISELYGKGLRVTSIQMNDAEGGKSERIIFPGAIISYGKTEFPVNLLKNNPALPYEVNLNNSIQSLEYEFAKAIHSLTLTEVPKIAFIEGHGELDSLQTYSIMDELKNFFQVDRGFINGNLEALLNYEALIIAQPMYPFNDADKFALDQYIMRGGKVLWFLDPALTAPDSLSNGMTISMGNPINIEDLLFKYGIRIDYNIVSDLQCNFVPVNTAMEGEPANFAMKPWVYNPLFTAGPQHPITNGLNYVLGQFASSFDTISDPDAKLKRTVLLSTSARSLSRRVPVRVMVEEVARDPDPQMFTQKNLPVAMLIEGSFDSFYANYSVPEGVYPKDTRILPKSEQTSMLVVTDGDMIRNEVRFQNGRYLAEALGYDNYTRQTFGNLEFIMNAVNYMTDDRGLMELRSREFRLRLLDKAIIKDPDQLVKWKLINTILPLLIIAFFGLAFYFYRKRKYTL